MPYFLLNFSTRPPLSSKSFWLPVSVSYTHLDVYKRQIYSLNIWSTSIPSSKSLPNLYINRLPISYMLIICIPSCHSAYNSMWRGFKFHISSSYSFIVLSLENLPLFAVLITAILAQASLSLYIFSSLSWTST